LSLKLQAPSATIPFRSGAPGRRSSCCAVLGASLFGFAAISCVAAHWTGPSKLAGLALLLGTLRVDAGLACEEELL